MALETNSTPRQALWTSILTTLVQVLIVLGGLGLGWGVIILLGVGVYALLMLLFLAGVFVGVFVESSAVLISTWFALALTLFFGLPDQYDETRGLYLLSQIIFGLGFPLGGIVRMLIYHLLRRSRQS